jgi:hypothetical protein
MRNLRLTVKVVRPLFVSHSVLFRLLWRWALVIKHLASRGARGSVLLAGWLVLKLLNLEQKVFLNFTEHANAVDRGQVLAVVHDVVPPEHFQLSWRRQHYLRVEVSRQAVLGFIVQLFESLLFLGEFVFLVDEDADVLANALLLLVVFVDAPHIHVQAHKLNYRLLTQHVLSHQVALHDTLSWKHFRPTQILFSQKNLLLEFLPASDSKLHEGVAEDIFVLLGPAGRPRVIERRCALPLVGLLSAFRWFGEFTHIPLLNFN